MRWNVETRRTVLTPASRPGLTLLSWASCCLLLCREIELLKLLQKFVTCNGTPVSSMQRRVLVRLYASYGDPSDRWPHSSGGAFANSGSPYSSRKGLHRINENGIEAPLFLSCTCFESFAEFGPLLGPCQSFSCRAF